MDYLQDVICPGDILVFKAGNDWVGKSIAWLTKSDVSHAAMMYSDNTIVEMGLSGIMVNKIDEDPNGGIVHILRLTPTRDPQPLVDATSVYVNNKIQYDLPSLVLLGGLMIYREIRPTPKLRIITDTILRLACAEVDKLIMNLRKDKKKTMICSQLVYQCHQDCNMNYHIRIQGGDLQSSKNAVENRTTIRLIDRLQQVDYSNFMIDFNPDVLELLPDQAAEVLYTALSDKEQTDDSDTTLICESTMDSILPIAKQLLEKLEMFLEEYETDLPVQALFITPGDLLNHAVNLKEIGVFKVKRTK